MFKVILSALTLTLIISLTVKQANAVSLTWTDSDPEVEIIKELHETGCEKEPIDVIAPAIINLPSGAFTTREYGCIVHGKTIDFAQGVTSNYVRLAGNAYYHKLGGSLGARLLPSTDVLVQRELRPGAVVPTKLVLYRDLPNMLVEGGRNNFGVISDYYPDSSKGDQQLTYLDPSDGMLRQRSVLQFALSATGKYILAYADSLDLTVINVNDGSVRTLGKLPIPQYATVFPFMAVSNNGEYVFIDNLNRIYGGTECGDSEEVPTFSYYMKKPCKEYSFGSAIEGTVKYYPKATYVRFSDDDQRIHMVVSPTIGEGKIFKIELRMPNYSNSLEKLDYLALGDSYSSGEGDIEPQTNGQPYYLPGTQGLGGCHVSSRSYPFLLAQYNVIKEDRMKSVACSGARLAKDYYGETGTYFGQTGQLKGQSTLEREAARSSALGDFTPGIVKQIEFIRAHKPKVVTLTGGGNDIGFGAIIKSCVYTVGIGNKTSTCEEVLSGSAKRVVIGDAIQTQFEEIKRFIKAIKSVSESTTIYVIGYPTFLADGPSTCVNSAALTQQEREGINDGVRFLNDVISSAAKSAGAKYVDIESSLSGGRLCEGSEYMTGVIDVTKGIETAQTFHPNYKGHREMAARIHGAGFALAAGDNPPASQTELPAKPGSFGSGQHVPTFQERLLADAAVVAGRAYPVTLATELGLTVRDKVRFTLYSKPADLGTYTVDIDGTLSTTLKIPANIPLGAHMLVADIISADGNVKRLYQYIEVRSKNPSDSDGDRIPNDLDTCPYIQSWIDERTGQDVCQIQKINGVLPGRGLGHGYGHVYSNGLHAGHEHDMSAIFKQ